MKNTTHVNNNGPAVGPCGIRNHAVPAGIVVQNTLGNISLLTTHIHDKSLLEANRDGVTSYQGIETIVSGTGWTANDGQWALSA